MNENSSVIDYIIDQANRYDIRNMQFEQDIISVIKRNRVILTNKISSLVKNDIDSLLKVELLMTDIDRLFTGFVNASKKILMDKFSQYARTGYDNTADLVQLGIEVSGKLNKKIKEQKQKSEYDEETINFIRDHAFDMMTGYGNDKIQKMRAKVSDMMLNGRATKSSVRDAIQKILDVDRSKAEEITQYELSRAYNYGTMAKLNEYKRVSGEKVRRYWHGFKYSDVTCGYCRERIGGIYDLDDNEEVLPAHIRCRCVWLPVLGSWESPVPVSLISRANMLNTAYSKDMIYQRINTRLDINYAEYLREEAALDYLSGDRSQKVLNAISNARSEYISNIKLSFGIDKDTSGSNLSNEFNQQMNFWKDIVAGAIADKDVDMLNRSVDAIKGVMILPWNVDQMEKWNKLLSRISI